MEILHIVLPLVLGALIGYVTNYIAVRMLFRPYRAVKIGSRTLPFTPGVIPKNKQRIAKACGAAVESSLFSQDDIKKAITGSIKKPDIDSIKVADIVSEDLSEQFAKTLADKLTGEIKKIDIKGIIAEKGTAILEEKVKDTMLAMFVNRDMIASFAEPIEQKVMQYLDGEGYVYLNLKIKGEIETVRNRTLGQEAAALNLDIGGFTDRIFDEFIDEKLGTLTSKIDIAAVVEDKINRMDVREFEKLVLSVMKKELQAVVNLGALIGFVIGLINLLVL